jgi:AcrR family transcriptional regulator
MPRSRLDDTRLLDVLTQLFREHGFEGASLTRIAEATGLQRASLYHRFPGGKEEIALRVLERVHERFATEILAPLAQAGSPAARLRKVAQRLDAFYEGGTCSCLIDALSLGRPSHAIQAAVGAALEAVTSALAGAAREAGHTPAAARRLAQDALLRIEGALVVARSSGDTAPFQRTLRELPSLLTGGAAWRAPR